MLLQTFLREYRSHRMARFTTWILTYGAALWLVDRLTQSGAPRALWSLFWLLAIVAAVYYLIRFVRFVRQRLLWRLRWRLVVTYVFIAVVPLVLILLLVAIGGGVILSGQFAAYVVVSNFRNRVDELEQLNRVVTHQVSHIRARTAEDLSTQLQDFVVDDLRPHQSSYPGLEVTIRDATTARAFRLDGTAPAHPVSVPPWLGDRDFADIVMDHGELALRAVDHSDAPTGEITLILSQPFTPELLDQVGAGIGPIGLLLPERGHPSPSTPQAAANGDVGLATARESRGPRGGGPPLEIAVRSRDVQVPKAVNFFDFTVHNLAALETTVWGGEQERHDPTAAFFYVSSRIGALSHQLLSTLGQLSGIYWTAFAVVAVVFLALEAVALVIGVRLTRTMTTTVDKLYRATERVKAGDFSYRIHLPANDQLSALGEAFDGMTASVERLLRESLEKTRLEGELEIAQEVQSRLFPQAVPLIPGLQLYGVCKPARVVSGDYYDFLRLGQKQVGLVLGDISGKGISAALLMAGLQSALHAQFYNGYSSRGASDAHPISTSEVVARLNRQLFANSPGEKYVTFFYAVYDAASRKLTYTNAGHLPPLLFRRGRIERLETGGTVVGLFPSMRYEQSEVILEPEDMLLAYTDGITEPENSYGEEFGEQRLLETVERLSGSSPEVLADEVYRTVRDWTGTTELQDDMTLVLARAV